MALRPSAGGGYGGSRSPRISTSTQGQRQLPVNGKSSTPSALSKASRSTGSKTVGGVSSFITTTPQQGPLIKAQRPQPAATQKQPESELNRFFDPNKDLHLWTMWRTAVTGRIMDDVKRSSAGLRHRGPFGEDTDDYPLGRALIKTPLDRFVRVENGSQTLNSLMADPHGECGSRLKTEQFIFYGLPRVMMNRPRKRTTQLPGSSLDSSAQGAGGGQFFDRSM